VALPITILHSSVATAAAAAASGSGALGSAEVIGVGCAAEVLGVGCVAAVGIVVGERREDVFVRVLSSSWAAVVAWRECIRL
jgi:hypothetical protein